MKNDPLLRQYWFKYAINFGKYCFSNYYKTLYECSQYIAKKIGTPLQLGVKVENCCKNQDIVTNNDIDFFKTYK